MTFPRRAGILLHVTSLPGGHGIGDLGEGAYQFVDFLSRTGQKIWQVLPLGPTARGDSPYSSYSAFAGNPLLVSLTELVKEGWLTTGDLAQTPVFAEDEVDYHAVGRFKTPLLKAAFDRFRSSASSEQRAEFDAFCEANRYWLDDFALYIALANHFSQPNWSKWDRSIAKREEDALQHWSRELAASVEFEKFVQFVFLKQWRALHAYANERGVEIFGDLPIFVAHESADVWRRQEYFFLDDDGRPTVVAGVPPDYFSATGQLWENPLYRWDVLEASGFDWWVDRFRHQFLLFDLVRVDHFRGFESYWEVPGTDDTAVNGQWRKGPGEAPFRAAERELGPLRIVAEDLGLITPEVHALREQLGYPGMRVLQFGYESHDAAFHRPESFPTHCVVYTGTHDNDTALGWYNHLRANDANRSEQDRALLTPLEQDPDGVHWAMIRLALSSVADTAVVPLQDVLGLDSRARMNTPGRPHGNWRWRFRRELLTPEIEQRLLETTQPNGR